MIQLVVPGRVTNPLNGSHRHWTAHARWAHAWRERTQAAWLAAGRPTWAGPATVTFTVTAPRRFDDDGLAACVKPVRDQAVRCLLDSDDGPACGHRFVYKQEVRPPAERGVLVTVEPLA